MMEKEKNGMVLVLVLGNEKPCVKRISFSLLKSFERTPNLVLRCVEKMQTVAKEMWLTNSKAPRWSPEMEKRLAVV